MTSTVTFFFPELRPELSSEIRDIEDLSNNLVFAPAIGTLVTYFSDERPVPYLAKKWWLDGNRWIFELRDQLSCENGEPINATNFAESLARTIRIYSSGGDHPVFRRIKGYRQLVSGRASGLEGIRADGNRLIFEFEGRDFSGFLEHLTMAPFGFVCSANFEGDKWKDRSTIISSGPFRFAGMPDDRSYHLIARENFLPEFASKFKNIVVRRGDLGQFKKHVGPKVIELFDPQDNHLEGFAQIRQMPQGLYILALNHKRATFESKTVRQLFARMFKEELRRLPFESKGYFKTERFYFNDKIELSEIPKSSHVQEHSSKPTSIVMKIANNKVHLALQEIAERTSKRLGWSITFDTDPSKTFLREHERTNFDLVVLGSEIGGGYESWIIDMLFCSDVGSRWPDPSGQICEFARKTASGEISPDSVAQQFQDLLTDDAAAIPTFHRGGFYLLSKDLDIKSLGPMVTRIRFEDVGPAL